MMNQKRKLAVNIQYLLGLDLSKFQFFRLLPTLYSWLTLAIYYTVITGILVCPFVPLDLEARHIVGGEITYECLGAGERPNTNRYQFKMNIYRDCQGGGAVLDSAPNAFIQATVSIYADPDILVANFELTDLEQAFIEPDANPCMEVPDNICVERGTYFFPVVELNIIDKSYFAVYQRCCRNQGINNIVNDNFVGATYFIELTPLAQQVCNNSPIFNKLAPIVVCAGDKLDFDHSATDIDGHRLEYEFCRPFDGGGSDATSTSGYQGIAPNPDAPPPYRLVIFRAPFTPTKPLGVDANLALHPTTGRMTAIPQIQGQYVLGVCIKEYDEQNRLLTEVRRDFQINVIICEPLVDARIANAEAQGDSGDDYFLRSCGDLDIALLNESVSEEWITEIQWEFYLTDSTIIANTWDLKLEFPEAGTYQGILAANPGLSCGDTATITVEVTPELYADFDYLYDSCNVSPIQFQDLSIADATQIQRQWTFGDRNNSNELNPSHLYEQPGTYSVSLLLEDEYGCSSQYIDNVEYYPRVQTIDIVADTTRICAPDVIQFQNLSQPLNEEYIVHWNFGDGTSTRAIETSHNYQEAGTYSLSLEFISPTGCRSEHIYTDLIKANPTPIADFKYEINPLTIPYPEVRFNNISIGGSRFFWDFGDGEQSINFNPIHSFQDTGLFTIQLIASNNVGCADTLLRAIDIVPDTRYFLPTAFTPNGDGDNDVFIGKGSLFYLADFSMTIYNRYGELVFFTDDPFMAWNGSKNNGSTALPQGVYVYAVRYRNPRGELEQQSGTLMLIR